jgi:cytochrome c oxidase subunit 2
MNNRKRLFFSLLLALLVWAAVPFEAISQAKPRVIEITAKRFEFSPNQITLKRGEPVILRLKSMDVTHGFFSRPLKLDTLIEPDKTNDVAITPQTAGTFPVICHHFCGQGHGNMKMSIIVE